ncbi:hypothetical protein Ancab_000041 [Ancistrocladus abbreviatus]
MEHNRQFTAHKFTRPGGTANKYNQPTQTSQEFSLVAPQGEPSLLERSLVRYHEHEKDKQKGNSPRRSSSSMNGVLLRERDHEGHTPSVFAGQPVNEEEEENRAYDEHELELIH